MAEGEQGGARWKGPKPQELVQDTNLFDMLGDDEGEEFKVPIKGKALEDAADEGPKITPKAEEKLKNHNESSNTHADMKLDPAKMKGTGKDGAITASDVTQEIGRLSRERAAAAAAAQRKSGVHTDPVNKKEPEVYDRDRTVYYAGHQRAVPDRRMKLEDVRAMMEADFPELSKENTDMIYDEERGAVIPVLRGHRKGSGSVKGSGKPASIIVDLQPNVEDLKDPVNYVLANDGYTYQIRNTQAGSFVTRMERGALAAREGFKLNVPKIPAGLLRLATRQFQAIPDKEFLVNFLWHASPIERYGLMVPDQVGSEASVLANGMMETESRFIVLQMHSHGIMPAFFSPTDDADEVRTGLYGVIGHCDRFTPDVRLRFSNAGEFRDVRPEDVFDWGWHHVVDVA